VGFFLTQGRTTPAAKQREALCLTAINHTALEHSVAQVWGGERRRRRQRWPLRWSATSCPTPLLVIGCNAFASLRGAQRPSVLPAASHLRDRRPGVVRQPVQQPARRGAHAREKPSPPCSAGGLNPTPPIARHHQTAGSKQGQPLVPVPAGGQPVKPIGTVEFIGAPCWPPAHRSATGEPAGSPGLYAGWRSGPGSLRARFRPPEPRPPKPGSPFRRGRQAHGRATAVRLGHTWVANCICSCPRRRRGCSGLVAIVLKTNFSPDRLHSPAG